MDTELRLLMPIACFHTLWRHAWQDGKWGDAVPAHVTMNRVFSVGRLMTGRRDGAGSREMAPCLQDDPVFTAFAATLSGG